MLSTIEEDLNTSTATGAWILTGFLLSSSVATPIVSRLGDMFGKRRMLIIALIVFAAGTVAAGVAPTIGVLFAARIAQGTAGALLPLAVPIIREEAAPGRALPDIALVAPLAGAGAFAAMGTLMVEAVLPEQTGIATGMNAIMRNIGGAAGTQVIATIVAGAAVADLPTGHGYALAPGVIGIALVAAFCLTLGVPRQAQAAVKASGALEAESGRA